MTSLLDGEVVINDSIPILGLRPHIRNIISLTPNTQYAIRTLANYRMTGYNADEMLSILSNLTTTRTLSTCVYRVYRCVCVHPSLIELHVG